MKKSNGDLLALIIVVLVTILSTFLVWAAELRCAIFVYLLPFLAVGAIGFALLFFYYYFFKGLKGS